MVIEDNTLLIFSSFLLGFCDCGCGKNLRKIYHGKKSIKFRQGHASSLRIGEKNSNWKGIEKKQSGYISIYDPKHPRKTKQNRVLKHRLLYEEYHKCCLLSWSDVHHINGKKDDNRIENLIAIKHGDHSRITHIGNHYTLGKHKNTSDRICHNCESKTTTMYNPNGRDIKTPFPRWYHLPHDKINWYCTPCFRRLSKLAKGKGVKLKSCMS